MRVWFASAALEGMAANFLKRERKQRSSLLLVACAYLCIEFPDWKKKGLKGIREMKEKK